MRRPRGESYFMNNTETNPITPEPRSPQNTSEPKAHNKNTSIPAQTPSIFLLLRTSDAMFGFQTRWQSN